METAWIDLGYRHGHWAIFLYKGNRCKVKDINKKLTEEGANALDLYKANILEILIESVERKMKCAKL